MTDEIQNYLNYIKSIGIQAWIPHSEGYGPKMSVADQCQSKILCLNYKGSDIYVQGNNHVAMTCNNDQRLSANNSDRAKSVWPHNMNRFDDSDAGNSTRKATTAVGLDFCTSTLREYSNGSVGVQCCRSDNDDLLKQTVKNTPRRLDKAVENDKTLYAPEDGLQFKRVVHEKLTREVRVAKCYVSSLPNVQYSFKRNSYNRLDNNLPERAENVPSGLQQNNDCKGRSEIVKSGRGLVRQLVKRFNVYNEEHQRNLCGTSLTEPQNKQI